MRALFALATCSLLLPAAVAEPAKDDKPKTAKVVVTAEVACMHCEFGEGESCATALKLDAKTPLLLEGQAAKDLFKIRFKKATAVVEGTLKLKDKQMVLVADKSRVLEPDKDKGDKEKDQAKAKGNVYVVGDAICGRCDLAVCQECTLAVRNGTTSIILQGPLAGDHAEGKGVIGVTGKLQIENGLIRLHASKVEKVEKK